jgi:hypothetical protein
MQKFFNFLYFIKNMHFVKIQFFFYFLSSIETQVSQGKYFQRSISLGLENKYIAGIRSKLKSSEKIIRMRKNNLKYFSKSGQFQIKKSIKLVFGSTWLKNEDFFKISKTNNGFNHFGKSVENLRCLAKCKKQFLV